MVLTGAGLLLLSLGMAVFHGEDEPKAHAVKSEQPVLSSDTAGAVPEVPLSVRIGRITSDGVQIRTGPGTDYEPAGTVKMGTLAEMTEIEGEWIQIDSEQAGGWIYAPYIEEVRDGIASFTAEGTKIMAEPDANSAPLSAGDKDGLAEITGASGEWSNILYAGISGWVETKYLQTKDGRQASVTASQLTVRRSSDPGSEVIGTIAKGENYELLKEEKNMALLQLGENKTGWVTSWYLQKSESVRKTTVKKVDNGAEIVITRHGTGLRSAPDASGRIIHRPRAGDTLTVTAVVGDWYETVLKDGRKAYAAGWIVTPSGKVDSIVREGMDAYLRDRIIVIDPGHGGYDQGAAGRLGTKEKDLTLETAGLLAERLEKAGAKVVMTRTDDSGLSLNARVQTARRNTADAFLSIHYDSAEHGGVSGMTSYYYHDFQAPLAEAMEKELGKSIQADNRGSRQGNYHVLRENKQVSVLLELGYLSNPDDERKMVTDQYQQAAAGAIYRGLAQYFKQISDK